MGLRKPPPLGSSGLCFLLSSSRFLCFPASRPQLGFCEGRPWDRSWDLSLHAHFPSPVPTPGFVNCIGGQEQGTTVWTRLTRTGQRAVPRKRVGAVLRAPCTTKRWFQRLMPEEPRALLALRHELVIEGHSYPKCVGKSQFSRYVLLYMHSGGSSLRPHRHAHTEPHRPRARGEKSTSAV